MAATPNVRLAAVSQNSNPGLSSGSVDCGGVLPFPSSNQEADDAKAGAEKWKRGGQGSGGRTPRQHATFGDRMEQGTYIDVSAFFTSNAKRPPHGGLPEIPSRDLVRLL